MICAGNVRDHPLGVTTSYAYDVLNRQTRVIDAFAPIRWPGPRPAPMTPLYQNRWVVTSYVWRADRQSHRSFGAARITA